jgi:putative endonuclease
MPPKQHRYYIYIMANPARTLYIGVTNDIVRRIVEHKRGRAPGFVTRYGLTKLVYCEEADNVHAALAREKQLKGWLRRKKVALIESMNPTWSDLAAGWEGETDPSLRSG